MGCGTSTAAQLQLPFDSVGNTDAVSSVERKIPKLYIDGYEMPSASQKDDDTKALAVEGKRLSFASVL